MNFIFTILIVLIVTVDNSYSQLCQCVGCVSYTRLPGEKLAYSKTCPTGQVVKIDKLQLASSGPSVYTVKVRSSATATTFFTNLSATTPVSCFSRENTKLKEKQGYVEILCQNAGVSGIAVPTCNLKALVTMSCVNEFSRSGDMNTEAAEPLEPLTIKN